MKNKKNIDMYSINTNGDYIDLISRLEEIRSLPNNWNGNNADIFSNDIIDKAKLFLSSVSNLAEHISIFPTANNSIQIEYETPNNIYCETEFFLNLIEIYAEKNSVELFDKSFKSINSAIHNFRKFGKLK